MMNYNPYQPQRNPLDEIKKFFRSGSALSMLMLINIAVWVLIQVFRVIFFFFNDPEGETLNLLIMGFLAVPADIPRLLTFPWTIITYNFLHLDIWHILFNMLWLYWFGKIFMEFLNSRQLILIYLLGGISGGLLYILAFNVFPVFSGMVPVSFALGASASVMAIVASISFYVPNYSIQLLLLGKIRIGYLALALFIFDFFMIPSGNSGGHLAHIGGAIFGVIYIYFFRTYHRASPGFDQQYQSFFKKVNDWFIRKPSGHAQEQKSAFSGSRPMTDDEYNKKRRENQDRIDSILEKISKGGYESLTREEKDLLFRSSNKR